MRTEVSTAPAISLIGFDGVSSYRTGRRAVMKCAHLVGVGEFRTLPLRVFSIIYSLRLFLILRVEMAVSDILVDSIERPYTKILGRIKSGGLNQK